MAYIDELGSVKGVTIRRSQEWFAISVNMSPSKIERMANKFVTLSGGDHSYEMGELTSTSSRPAYMYTEFGQEVLVQVSSENAVEARIITDLKFLPGTGITLNGSFATIDRLTSEGFFAKFRK